MQEESNDWIRGARLRTRPPEEELQRRFDALADAIEDSSSDFCGEEIDSEDEDEGDEGDEGDDEDEEMSYDDSVEGV